jgi:mRNA interferase RelE/StbE
VAFRVEFLPAAERAFWKLTPEVRNRLRPRIDALAEIPRSPGSKKLVGEDRWRIRVGDWRIVYQVDDDRLVVLVVRVGHRGDIYRGR